MNFHKVRANSQAVDSGAALILVMVGMAVLTMVATVALTYSTQTLKTTRHTQDSIAALAAAQAGVDEYIARLNQLDTYWQKNPFGVGSASLRDCANVATKRPPTTAEGTRCGWTSTTTIGWVDIPTTAPGGALSSFHYDIDATATPINGTISLKVTGKSNKLNRTIALTLRRGGFGEFLYYTDYETIDPANEAIYGLNNQTALDKCAHHFWDPVNAPSKPRDTSYCADIQFIQGDVINGPTHSNDAIKIDTKNPGPSFLGNVSTSWPNCRPINGVLRPASSCYRSDGTAYPNFVKGINYSDLIDLPTSIGSLLQYVDPAQTTTPGCLYTGPTRIKFLAPVGGAVVSKMQVWSRYSKTLNAGCGNPSASWPQTMDIPNNNIIIVQNVPSTQTSPPPLPPSGACATGGVGDGLPQAGDTTQNLSEEFCTKGNVYLEGQLAGKLTISAGNNIVITGNLKYNSGTNGADVLGLIANNSVKIYHPTCEADIRNGCNRGDNMDRPNGAGKFRDPIVQAAILTLQHSFTVQYYQSGSTLGAINLFGSFSQKYRGPVGTSNNGTPVSGYLKSYVYDTRLRYAPPPFFLDPIHSTWGVKTFGELNATYVGL